MCNLHRILKMLSIIVCKNNYVIPVHYFYKSTTPVNLKKIENTNNYYNNARFTTLTALLLFHYSSCLLVHFGMYVVQSFHDDVFNNGIFIVTLLAASSTQGLCKSKKFGMD